MPEVREGREVAPPWTLALAGGVAFAAGYPPRPAWPLTFAGVALGLAALLRAGGRRETVACAVLTKAAAVVPALSYLSGVSPLAHALVASVFLAVWTLLGLAFWELKRAGGRAAALGAFPFLWTLAEWTANDLHFLPSHIISWWDALAEPGLALAPYTGLYGVTFLAACGVALATTAREWRRGSAAGRRTLLRCCAPWAPAALAPLVLAATLERRAPEARTLRVAAAGLAANDSLEEHLESGEWTPERRAGVLAHIDRRMGELDALLAGERPDLLVLPEDAIDFTLRRSRSEEAYRLWGVENNGALLDAYRALARKAGVDLAAGMTTVRAGARRNSVVVFGRDGSLAGLRDKYYLTPGSERWPLGRWLPVWLAFAGDPKFAEHDMQYVPAEEPFPLLRAGGWSLGAAICLEGQMPSAYRAFKRAGADAIVYLSNAHWFRADPGGYNAQVLRMVRLAAAAYGLPVVLTGKAGYVGQVDERGRASVWPAFGPGSREQLRFATVAAASRSETVPSRYGEYYALLSALGLAFCFATARVSASA
ncbi:MAG: hypothetical protein HY554_02620 [Elusimicrobia bacterium]|nr:hypothetical protein [Elusimicrobiota bacterium]